MPAAASLPIDLANLPLLGARTDTHALFQYLLVGAQGDEVEFAVPGWLALREHLTPGAQVTLHLPFRAREDEFDQGEVVSATADSEQGGQRVTLRLTGRSALRYPVRVEPTAGAVSFRADDGTVAEPTALAAALLRDSALGKSGVRVYFKHLVPLFSRITEFPDEDYRKLRQVLLEEIRQRIIANTNVFTDWAERLAAPGLRADDLPALLDLETLRAATEPEINNELFDAVFNTGAITQYLDAIRLIERRLCLNHNTLVLLCSAAL